MLCAGLLEAFCDTMPSTTSQSCDVSDTDGTCKSFTVGKYPQPHGDSYNGMVSSISTHISWDHMKWANALKQLPIGRDTPKRSFKLCHFAVNTSKAFSILIQT
jgi:hypothetical protein